MKTIAGILTGFVCLYYHVSYSQKADFQYSGNCNGDTTVLYSTCTPPSGDSIWRLCWDLDGDGRFNDSIGTAVVVKKYFDQPGKHVVGVQMILYSGGMDAIYKPVPVVKIIPDFDYGYTCLNLPVQFTDMTTIVDSADDIMSYQWLMGDGTVKTNEEDPTHNYNAAGTYQVTLTVTSLLGCRDSIEKSLDIKNPPVVDVAFSGDTVFPLGDSVVATIVPPVNNDYDSVFWSTGDTTTSIVIKNTDYYSVQGFLNGCYGEFSFSVTAVEDHTVRVMNLFTPNDDGFNDRWEIINIQEVEPCSVDIFDRWGQKVFSASPYNNDWDGTFNGRQLSNDTYYYFLRCKDLVLQKGHLTILK